MRVLIALLVTFLSPFSASTADETPVVLAGLSTTNFVPVDAYFFVSPAGHPSFRSKGEVVVANPKSGENERQVATGILFRWPRDVSSVEYRVLLVGEGGQMAMIQAQTVAREQGGTAGLATKELRDRVEGMRADLRKLLLDQGAQRATIERLKRDASIIGNVERIVSTREETATLQEEVDTLSRDERRLERLLELAKSSSTPSNYRLRELTLNAENAALASAVRAAEKGEFQRRVAMEHRLQEELRLIEKSKRENPDELAGELERLRQRNKLMEGRFGALP